MKIGEVWYCLGCFIFTIQHVQHSRYHMHGSAIGKLNFYAKTKPALGRPTWTRSGDNGDQWQQAVISLPTTGTYTVSCNKQIKCEMFYFDVVVLQHGWRLNRRVTELNLLPCHHWFNVFPKYFADSVFAHTFIALDWMIRGLKCVGFPLQFVSVSLWLYVCQETCRRYVKLSMCKLFTLVHLFCH